VKDAPVVCRHRTKAHDFALVFGAIGELLGQIGERRAPPVPIVGSVQNNVLLTLTLTGEDAVSQKLQGEQDISFVANHSPHVFAAQIEVHFVRTILYEARLDLEVEQVHQLAEHHAARPRPLARLAVDLRSLLDGLGGKRLQIE
jgi:hypothetical protein